MGENVLRNSLASTHNKLQDAGVRMPGISIELECLSLPRESHILHP
jgi:hypothetical protein